MTLRFRHSSRRLSVAAGGRYLTALGIVALTLVTAMALRALVHLPDLVMLFLLAVMLTASRMGRGPSVLAAVLSVSAYDFFFVPPFYTFTVGEKNYVLTFAIMLAISLVMSEMTAKLRQQERAAHREKERALRLYDLANALAHAPSAGHLGDIAARDTALWFKASVVVLQSTSAQELIPIGCFPADSPRLSDRVRNAQDGLRTSQNVQRLIDGSLLMPLETGGSVLGALLVQGNTQAIDDAEERIFLGAFAREIASALHRTELAVAAENAALKARTEEMRAAVLSTVSHDLRTPLATVAGAASTLRNQPGLSTETQIDLLDSIIDEAARLERLVANLLDMTRLEAGNLRLKLDWVPLEEIIGGALTRLEAKAGRRAIVVQLDESIPLLKVDACLMEQAFINLIENALKYTPPDLPIEIRAKHKEQCVLVEVIDQGPGLPSGAERIFDKFVRGHHPGIPGAGLGLAICKGIVQAHQGAIWAVNRDGGGAVFHVQLFTQSLNPLLPGSQRVAA